MPDQEKCHDYGKGYVQDEQKVQVLVIHLLHKVKKIVVSDACMGKNVDSFIFSRLLCQQDGLT